jgi:hypothetical protein
MDNGSSRYKKCNDAKIHSATQPLTEHAVASFEEIVLNKGDVIAPTAALNCVRNHMRLLYSSEQETFRQFQNYFENKDPIFASQFKIHSENEYDSVKKWMKNSLIPFGKELLDWCCGGSEAKLEEGLYFCNGNVYLLGQQF